MSNELHFISSFLKTFTSYIFSPSLRFLKYVVDNCDAILTQFAILQLLSKKYTNINLLLKTY